MKTTFSLLLLFSVIGILGGVAMAGPVPPGWTCVGTCGTLGADGVVTLGPSGNPYKWVSTVGGIVGVGSYPGVGGTGNPTNGSVLTSSTFAAKPGDPLHFYFNFVTSDGGTFNDYGWVALVDASTSASELLFTARTWPGFDTVPGYLMPSVAAGVTLTTASTPIVAGGPVWSSLGAWSGYCWDVGCGYTGWIGSSYNISNAGNYYLQFGMINWDDQLYDSGLAIDSVTLNGIPIPGDDTPEPGSLVLLGSGVVGVASLLRSKLLL